MSAVDLGSKRIKVRNRQRSKVVQSSEFLKNQGVCVCRHPHQNTQQAKHQYLETNTGNILMERAIPKAKWEETKGKIQEKLESVTKH